MRLRSAGFQTCCIAGFQVGRALETDEFVECSTVRRFRNLRYSRFGNLRYEGAAHFIMTYRPSSIADLSTELARANSLGEKRVAFDLGALNRVLEYAPEDMTVTVEAGITLAALQARLAEKGQWLPIDPPFAQTTSIADIINSNASGPRRLGYGTIREHLLGITVVMADGRLVHGGGKVVKNVAGYDLCKLFVGAHGSLGVVVEATFKVRPLPEAERFVSAQCESWSQAQALLEAVHKSELTPVLLDLWSVGASERVSVESVNVSEPPRSDASTLRRPHVILGLAGTREAVEWQLNKARELGLSTPATLDYESAFWSNAQHDPVHRISVLPSRLCETVQGLRAHEFVARAGNGVIYYRGGNPPPGMALPVELMRRMKETYDPKRTLPDLPGLAL